jgi:hypothetical protein
MNWKVFWSIACTVLAIIHLYLTIHSNPLHAVAACIWSFNAGRSLDWLSNPHIEALYLGTTIHRIALCTLAIDHGETPSDTLSRLRAAARAVGSDTVSDTVNAFDNEIFEIVKAQL